jgi:hypothetical protein
MVEDATEHETLAVVLVPPMLIEALAVEQFTVNAVPELPTIIVYHVPTAGEVGRVKVAIAELMMTFPTSPVPTVAESS